MSNRQSNQLERANACEATLAELGVDKHLWAKKVVDVASRRKAEDAVRYLFERLYAAVVDNELKTRNINLNDLQDGSWIIVKFKQDYTLAVVLQETSPRMFRCWLGSDSEIETVDALNIWRHLTDYYPAPIALDGKSVLDKAKIQYRQIEDALTCK